MTSAVSPDACSNFFTKECCFNYLVNFFYYYYQRIRISASCQSSIELPLSVKQRFMGEFAFCKLNTMVDIVECVFRRRRKVLLSFSLWRSPQSCRKPQRPEYIATARRSRRSASHVTIRRVLTGYYLSENFRAYCLATSIILLQFFSKYV